MEQGSIINEIQGNPEFAIGFAMDNNPEGVIANLVSMGYPVKSPVEAYNTLMDWLKGGRAEDIEKIKVVFNNTDYIDSVNNYTGNLRTYFMSTTPANKYPTNLGAKFDWTGLLAGLGAGLSVFSAYNAAGSSPNGTPNQPGPSAAEAEAKAKRKKIYLILGITGGVIVLGVIAYFVFRKKKGGAAS